MNLCDEEDCIIVDTVSGNFEGYTKTEVKAAHEAYKARGHTGNIPEQDLACVVHNQSVVNCDITPRALSNATEIFGPYLPGVRGKSVRRKLDRVITDRICIPRDFQRIQQSVTCVADIFFMNEIPFLITLSRKMKFVTVEHI